MTTTTANTATTANVQVGDFFYSSWGYDQTNVDFYKVVGMTASGKSVKVQPWTLAHTPDGVVPGDGPKSATAYIGVQTKRIHHWGSTASFTVNSYSNAYLWDGTPKYQTPYGYGH